MGKSTYHRDIIIVKVLCHRLHVLLIVVVPPALVVCQTELGWKGCVSSQLAVLARHVFWLRAQKNEHVHDARLGNPVSLDLRLGLARPDKVRDRAEDAVRVFLDVDPRFRCVEPEESGRSNLVVSNHEGDGCVQGHRVPDLELENVQVVQSENKLVINKEARWHIGMSSESGSEGPQFISR